ncbi:MAG: metallophosphoesterase, partial [Oscillospiraceae bacterium]|nr:metallophosphoesterase [Oscillospiraceae bacterium]
MKKKKSTRILSLFLAIWLSLGFIIYLTPVSAEDIEPDVDILLMSLTRTIAATAEEGNQFNADAGVYANASNLTAWDNDTQITIGGTGRTPIVINNAATSTASGWIPASVVGIDNASAFEIKFSTENYENIRFSCRQKSTGSGPDAFKLAYRIGSTGSFTAISDTAVNPPRISNDTYGALEQTYDEFILPDLMENEDEVYLRIYFDGLDNLGKNGNTSINDIVIIGDAINGTVVPEYDNIDIDVTNTIANTSPDKISVSFDKFCYGELVIGDITVTKDTIILDGCTLTKINNMSYEITLPDDAEFEEVYTLTIADKSFYSFIGTSVTNNVEETSTDGDTGNTGNPNDTVTTPAADQNGTPYDISGDYDVTVPHIIINQIYGGQKVDTVGYTLDNTVPVSHSFCELYNPTDKDIDLDGWTLHYGHNGEYADDGQQRGDWAKLELSGTIKAHTSFLVRMKETTATSAYLRLNLYNDTKAGKSGDIDGIGSADQDWDQYAINKGGVFVLIAGDVDLNKDENPFDNSTGEPAIECYVDMLGVGGNDSYNGNIFAYEGNYTGSQSKQKSIRRVDFIDTDHNATEDDVSPPYAEADTLIIGYNVISLAQLAWARPRAQADGVWATYQSGVNSQAPMPPPEVTTVLDAVKPNSLTNIVGTDSKTTRLITWQMPSGTTAGKIKYGTASDLTGSSEINATLSANADSTVKLVVSLTGLTAGTTYYYSVAGDGITYDNKIYSFKTDDGGTFSFVHVSDTQGVDESQYRDYWGPAVSKIVEEYSDVSFLLETGDLIDTRNDADQWRWFFKYAQEVFGNYAFVPAVGNHEQTANYDADMFRQHFTVPNALVHNDVTPGTVYSFNYGSAHFVILNSECKTDEGKAAIRNWLDDDLKNNNQKWTIVALHRGPFGMGGAKVDLYYDYVDILIDYSADLILHGHDHVYIRCYGNSDDDDPDSPGIYSLESGGSGFKQDNTPGSGKYVDVTAIVNNPSYSIITVSDEKISVESVYVDFNDKKDKNIYPIKTTGGDSVDFEIIKTDDGFIPETLTLTPGSDTSEINLTWYSDDSFMKTSVQFSTSSTFENNNTITVTGIADDATATRAYHKATVTGLTANTTYYYRVSNDEVNYSESYTYKTPGTGTFTFAAVGDPQLTIGGQDSTSNYFSNPATTAQGWKDTVNAITTKIPHINFITGVGDQVDLTANGSEAEYFNFFAPDALRNLPFAPAVGNHDRHYPFIYHYNIPNEQSFTPLMGADYSNSGNTQYAEMESAGNYFYTYNNALFVVLNDSAYPTSTLAAKTIIDRFDKTIKTAITANPNYTWLFVQHHKSTASVADHLADRDIQYYVEAGFEQLMDTYGVDFVLAGHDHVYARSYPMKNGRHDDNQNGPSITDPNGTIYVTITTASGLKYYDLFDGEFGGNVNLYVKDNLYYPYLADGTTGSAEYVKGKLPLSNAVYLQAKKPEFTSITVTNNTVTFATYNIDDLDIPIDEFTVAKTNATANPMTKTLTIFHTNDLHGNVGGSVFGMDKIAALRKQAPNSLLVDAGDATQGNSFATLTKGKDVIELMNMAGYDVMAAGNHEFDYGLEQLIENANFADFPILSANSVKDGKPVLETETNNGAWFIKEVNEIKVGFFGITTPETATKTNPDGIAGITFGTNINDIKTISLAQIDALKTAGADMIVGIMHLGIDPSSDVTSEAVATALKDSGLDIIIDGHSHSNFDKIVDGIYIAQAENGGSALGKIEITFSESKDIININRSRIPTVDAKLTPYKSITDRYNEMIAAQSVLLDPVVGKTSTTLWGGTVNGINEARAFETNLGNLIADSMLDAAKEYVSGKSQYNNMAVVALQNGGGIRITIYAGEITVGDVISVLPFGNSLAYKIVTPKILFEALENGVSRITEQDDTGKIIGLDGRFPQIAGMRFEFDPNATAGSRVTAIYLDGETVSLDRTENTRKIILASNDFEIAGGDGYTMLSGLESVGEGGVLDEVLADYISRLTAAGNGSFAYPIYQG